MARLPIYGANKKIFQKLKDLKWDKNDVLQIDICGICKVRVL